MFEQQLLLLEFLSARQNIRDEKFKDSLQNWKLLQLVKPEPNSHQLKTLTPMNDQDRISPYNNNTTSSRPVINENEEKYQLGDYKWIQYQILQTNITRTAWLTVWRITCKILGVNPLTPKISLAILLTTAKQFSLHWFGEFVIYSINNPSLVCMILYRYCKEKFCLLQPLCLPQYYIVQHFNCLVI